MSFTGSRNMVHELVTEFVRNMRSVDGVEKLVNLTGERLMKCSEEQDFEESLFRFYVENLAPVRTDQGKTRGDIVMILEVK